MPVSGLDEVVKRLNKVTPAAKKAVKAANKQAAAGVAKEAKARAPVLTGRLAKTIKPYGTTSASGVQVGGSKIRYAGPIHFGWARHGIEPNPFLYDALDVRRDEVFEAYERNLAKVLDEIGF